jgi:DNA-binding transcriptional LysR family regulator
MREDRFLQHGLRPRHLALLVALDEYRHVGRAASALHVTQPAASKALAEVEKGLECQLFERTPQGITPTPSGEFVINVARGMLKDLAHTGEGLRALKSGSTGTAALGVLPVAAPVLVPKAVAAMKRQAPRTTVSLVEGTWDTLLPMLRQGHVDLIVGTLPPRRLDADLAHEMIAAEDPVVVAVGANHPLAKARQVTWTDLVRYPWIMPLKGTSMRQPLEEALITHDVALPADIIESVSVVINKTLLQETECVGFLSRHIADHYRELGFIAVLPLEFNRLIGPVGVAWIRSRALPAACRLMVSSLRETAAALT